MLELDLSRYDLVPPVEYCAGPHQGTSNTTINVHTGSGRYVWKQYGAIHDLASIRYEHRLLEWLVTKGLTFAIPAPIASRNGLLLTQQGKGWGALTRFFDGERCNTERLDHVELLGVATAELQRALLDVPIEPRPGKPLFTAIFDFPRPEIEPLALTPQHLNMPTTREHDALCGWWREEAAQLETFVQGAYRALPWQVCHNDMSPANVLIDHERVSAVLDFEFACPAAPALDVAMGLRMTMRIWENVEPWEAVQRYMRGYSRFAMLTPEEIVAMPLLLRLRSAIPTLWSMGRRQASVLRSIEYLQNMARWLEHNQDQLIEVIGETPGPQAVDWPNFLDN